MLDKGESYIAIKVFTEEVNKIELCSKSCYFCEHAADGYYYCHLILDEAKRPSRITPRKEPCMPLAKFIKGLLLKPLDLIRHFNREIMQNKREALIRTLEMQNELLIVQLNNCQKEIMDLKNKLNTISYKESIVFPDEEKSDV